MFMIHRGETIMPEKKGLKIVTIGGGSSYTPELMQGFISRYENLPVREIWLVDVPEGEEKLKIVGALAQRMWDASPYDVKVHLTLDRREALKDADFVTTQFRVGLLNARIKDERIPLSYGQIGQETNGAGGIFKALRTIPVILDIVRDMKELCPDAWLINFTNPSGMITEAVIRRGNFEKCIGLCNGPITVMKEEPLMLGGKQSDYSWRFAGLNHFHYHRVWDRNGKEVTAQILAKMAVNDTTNMANVHDEEYLHDQLSAMNCIPFSYHRYYYMYEEMLERQLADYRSHTTRAESVRAVEEQLFELYKDPELHEMPELLKKRGGAWYSDAACETISNIYNDTGRLMVVNTVNNGAIECLDRQSIVEVSSLIHANGAVPLVYGEFDASERGWLQVMKAMEECVIEAAVSGDYGKLLKAFQINPLIRHGAKAKQMMDEMLIANEKYLPQFKDTIAKLRKAGTVIHDEKVRELCEKGL